MAHQGIEQASKRRGFLFGRSIQKSLSPLLHDTVFAGLGLDWTYERVDTDDVDLLVKCLQDDSLYGAAVTMPHKLTIMKHLDQLTDICREVGACNTIFITEKGGHRVLCGTNTDVIGVREAFYRNVTEPDKIFENRPVMIIGGGGAARSAIYAAQKWMRATQIYLVNRDELEIKSLFVDGEISGHSESLLHVENIVQAQGLPSPGAIISCIPDFVPQTPKEKLVREILEVFLRRDNKGVLLDMCYAPSPRTQINTLAKQEGWSVIPGTEMMIWQALEQDKYWTGRSLKEMPVQQVKAAIAHKLASNIASSVSASQSFQQLDRFPPIALPKASEIYKWQSFIRDFKTAV